MEFEPRVIRNRRDDDLLQKRPFFTELRDQLVGGAVIAVALVSYGFVASLTGSYLFPTVSGASLLAGYGILATLVVAIQVMARDIDRAEKLKNPTAAKLIRALASLVLFGSMALAVLGIFGSFAGPLELPRRFPAVDTVRLTGSILFSALIGLPAAEARILTEVLPEQQQVERERAIEEARKVILSYPGRRPGKILLGAQWLIFLVLVPVGAGWLANMFWKGPLQDGITLGIVAAASETVVFPLLREAITALHNDRHGRVALCALGCAALTAGPLALSLAAVSQAGPKIALAVGIASFVPLIATVMFCLPAHGKRWPRGIVIQSALKGTVRNLRFLRQTGDTAREAEQRRIIARRIGIVATLVLCLPLGLLLTARSRGRANRS